MTATIEIDNLKCGGCANTIKKSLNLIKGVNVLEVNPETDMVSLTLENDHLLEKVKKKLRALGYPEKGTLDGISGVAAGAKSYLSCMIGKLNK